MKRETVSKKQLLTLKSLPYSQEKFDIIYKEIFTFENEKENLEFVKNIMALANTKGGYFIYGVTAENNWIGLDERSDENIINENFYNLFEKYLSHAIQISSNLIEIDDSYYFVIYVEPVENLLYFTQNGIHTIKSWGNNQEKNITIFNTGESYYRNDKKTELVDEEFIINKNILTIPDLTSEITNISTYSNILSATKSQKTMENQLPEFITNKIKQVINLENEIILYQGDNFKIGDLESIDENIEQLTAIVDKANEVIIQKEIKIMKFNDEYNKINLYTSKNRELENEYYKLMDLKTKTISEKNPILTDIKLAAPIKEQITNKYQELIIQLKYNWEKEINQIASEISNKINDNEKVVSSLKEKLDNVNVEEVALLKQEFKNNQVKLEKLKIKSSRIRFNNEKINEIKSSIQNLKIEIDKDSLEYMSKLISKQFTSLENKTDQKFVNIKDIEVDLENKSAKQITNVNLKESFKLDQICIS